MKNKPCTGNYTGFFISLLLQYHNEKRGSPFGIYMKPVIIVLLLLLQGDALATSDTMALREPVQRLIALGDSVLKGSTDSVKEVFNLAFSNTLDSILRVKGGTALSFAQIPALSVAISPDKQVKALTWLVGLNKGMHYKYFGYILFKNEANTEMKIISLHHNNSLAREELEWTKCDSSSWIGCIYYSIHQEKYKKKKYYLLLGWAPQNIHITRKIAEPLLLNPVKISLGAASIKAGGKAKSRLVFEYNAQATMSLRYHEKMKMIVMDHLSPSDPRPEAKGMYSLYGPDLSYDGLKFSKGQWLLVRDVDVKN